MFWREFELAYSKSQFCTLATKTPPVQIDNCFVTERFTSKHTYNILFYFILTRH